MMISERSGRAHTRVTPLPVLDQHLEVAFHYPVFFTQDLFAVDNPLLAETIASATAELLSRFLCVIDRGVVRSWPRRASHMAYAGMSSVTVVWRRDGVDGPPPSARLRRLSLRRQQPKRYPLRPSRG